MKQIIITAIRVYQFTLSAVLGPRCRFYPTCSHYAAEAVKTHGVAKGLGLTVRRVIKCHPFHPGGFDPVPEHQLTTNNIDSAAEGVK